MKFIKINHKFINLDKVSNVIIGKDNITFNFDKDFFITFDIVMTPISDWNISLHQYDNLLAYLQSSEIIDKII